MRVLILFIASIFLLAIFVCDIYSNLNSPKIQNTSYDSELLHNTIVHFNDAWFKDSPCIVINLKGDKRRICHEEQSE